MAMLAAAIARIDKVRMYPSVNTTVVVVWGDVFSFPEAVFAYSAVRLEYSTTSARVTLMSINPTIQWE
jgi:hypothetical protein